MAKLSIVNVDGVEVFETLTNPVHIEAYIQQGWKEVKEEEIKETKEAKAK